jgi:hypothetical protein
VQEASNWFRVSGFLFPTSDSAWFGLIRPDFAVLGHFGKLAGEFHPDFSFF